MNRFKHALRRLFLAIALLALAGPLPAAARESEKWIGSWSASPQHPMPGAAETFDNQTLRLIVHTSVGGARVRIRISNLFGDAPLTIGSAHVARRAKGATIDPASDRVLTFADRRSFTIPARSVATSDPVDLDIPALSDVAISLFLPKSTSAATTHVLALQTSHVAAGDHTASADFPVAAATQSWPFLAAIDVATTAPASAVVAFGDSTIDGDGSTTDANARWPDVLARRLHAAGLPVGVLNQGIIGNRLLRESPPQSAADFGEAFGEAAVTRFDRDALAQTGAGFVIVRLGVNDIAFPGVFSPAAEAPTAEQLIAGYRTLIARAHDAGLRIIGTTISPFEGTTLAPGLHTPEKESVRQRVNAWIRESGAFDAIVDFDSVLRDPDHPTRLLPQYDSGDHLHPNDAGYAAAANAIPLTLFAPR
jgi:lysophospholipase L1-like esterase